VVIKEGVKAFVIGCYNCCKLLLLVCWFVVSWLLVCCFLAGGCIIGDCN
jgi:hypothetical protein